MLLVKLEGITSEVVVAALAEHVLTLPSSSVRR